MQARVGTLYRALAPASAVSRPRPIGADVRKKHPGAAAPAARYCSSRAGADRRALWERVAIKIWLIAAWMLCSRFAAEHLRLHSVET